MTLLRLPALNVKVNEIQTRADPAVLWLRARQLCYLGCHAPEKSKDVMPADLADSLKADEEDRKTDHAPLVAATENQEVATLTATIETNLRQGDLGVEVDSMKGDLAETENSLAGDEASSEREERQKSRADGLRSRLLLGRERPRPS